MIEIFEKIELERYNLCLELYKLLNTFTEGNIFGHFYACDIILFPDYQLISRQITNQLAHGHKTIVSHLNDYSMAFRIRYYVYQNNELIFINIIHNNLC